MLEVKGKLDRFEGKNAIIKTADEQEIGWPIKLLPDELKAGAEVKISLTLTQTNEESQGNLAKDMLNEIFNDQDNSAQS